MRPLEAIRTLSDQIRFYAGIRGSALSRATYFAVYYFCWIFLRWGDRHKRAMCVLRTLGLQNQVARIRLPDHTCLSLDQYSVHNVLYSVYRQKVYEPTAAFIPRPGDVVLDVGAQQGTYTCRAALQVGRSGRVIAFEPHPGNRALLTENVQRNRLTQVKIEPIAIFNREGQLSLYVHSESVNHSLVNANGGAAVLVPCMTLDHWSRTQEGLRVDILKIDVEGAELAVLQGAGSFLATAQPKIVMEYEVPEDLAEITSILKRAHYQVVVQPGYLYALPASGIV